MIELKVMRPFFFIKGFLFLAIVGWTSLSFAVCDPPTTKEQLEARVLMVRAIKGEPVFAPKELSIIVFVVRKSDASGEFFEEVFTKGEARRPAAFLEQERIFEDVKMRMKDLDTVMSDVFRLRMKDLDGRQHDYATREIGAIHIKKLGDEPIDVIVSRMKKQLRVDLAAKRITQPFDEKVYRTLLKDSDVKVRRMAVSRLGLIGIPAIIGLLISALMDDDEEVQEEAISGLNRFDDESLARSDTPELRATLTRMTGDKDKRLGAAAHARASRILAICLRQDLNHPNSAIRIEAIRNLGRLRYYHSYESLRHALRRDREPSVRVAVIDSFVSMRGRFACSTLARSLRDDRHPSVRRRAAEALGHLGGRREIMDLAFGTRDRDSSVRRSALEALRRVRYRIAEREQTREMARQVGRLAGLRERRDLERGMFVELPRLSIGRRAGIEAEQRWRQLGKYTRRLTMRDFLIQRGMKTVSLESDAVRDIWKRLERDDVARIQRLLVEKRDGFSGFCVRAPMKWEKKPVTILFASPKYADWDKPLSDDEYEEFLLEGGSLDLGEKETVSGANALVAELEKRAPSALVTEIEKKVYSDQATSELKISAEEYGQYLKIEKRVDDLDKEIVTLKALLPAQIEPTLAISVLNDDKMKLQKNLNILKYGADRFKQQVVQYLGQDAGITTDDQQTPLIALADGTKLNPLRYKNTDDERTLSSLSSAERCQSARSRGIASSLTATHDKRELKNRMAERLREISLLAEKGAMERFKEAFSEEIRKMKEALRISGALLPEGKLCHDDITVWLEKYGVSVAEKSLDLKKLTPFFADELGIKPEVADRMAQEMDQSHRLEDLAVLLTYTEAFKSRMTDLMGSSQNFQNYESLLAQIKNDSELRLILDDTMVYEKFAAICGCP